MKQRIFSIFLVLCMIVSMLPVPALAAEAVCGQELHAHDGECYSPKLDCGETAHVHGTECDQVSKALTCTLPASHTHGESCGGNEDGTPACGKSQAHVHSADCADCGYETACDHASDSCYNITTSRVCGLDEHAHEDGCYSETETVLTCGKVEHAHEDGCYPPECDCETLCEADAMNADCDICGAEGAKPEGCRHYVAPTTEAEKTCGCDTACEADTMNGGCDICGAEGAKPESCRHYVAPTTEGEKTCGCDTACEADAMNGDCDICGAEGAKPESCKHYVAPTPVCDCGTLCEADAMNGDCDICGAEGAAPEGCKHYVPPTCTCSIRCGETLNADCDICGAEGARAEECKGPTQACLDALALLAALPRAEEVTEDITESVHKKWTAQAQEALEAVRGLSMEEIASLETHADFVNATALWSALEKVTPVPAVDHICGCGTFVTEWKGNVRTGTTISGDQTIYLSDDATVSGGMTVNNGATLKLCLQGHTLDLIEKSITVNAGGRLYIYDCEGGGVIQTASKGNGVINNAGSVTVNSGTISGAFCGIYSYDSGSATVSENGSVTASGEYGINNVGNGDTTVSGSVSGPTGISSKGGTVTVSGTVTGTGSSSGYHGIHIDGGEAKVTGGTVSGYDGINIDSGEATVSGGIVTGTQRSGIFNDGGTVNMESGTVTGTTASSAYGIYANAGTTNITGGTVSGKRAGVYIYSGSTYLSGTPKISGDSSAIYFTSGNLYAHSNASSEAAPYLGDSLTVEINSTDNTLDKPVVKEVTEANKGKFSVTNEGFTLQSVEADGVTNLVLAKAQSHIHEEKPCTAVDSTTGLPDTAGSYYLTEDVTISSTWKPADGTLLCLNGCSIISTGTDAVITIGSGVTFTLYDCEGSGKITHNYGTTGIQGQGVFNSGTFRMYGGSIADNYYSQSGCGVYNGGTFHMYGGRITGNQAPNSGTGVYVASKGSFYMYDGEITQNETSSYGGGVYVNGTFNMSDGTISGNTAANDGAGVYVSGTFNMSGGAITGNTAGDGAGVYANANSTIKMSGGSITGNTATASNSGGVYKDYTAGFTVSGLVRIQDNLNNNSGAANVYLHNSLSRIKIGDGGLDDNARIGVYCSVSGTKQVTDSGNATEDDLQCFTCDSSGYEAFLQNGNIYIAKGHIHAFTNTNAWSSDEKGHWHPCTAAGCSVSDFSGVAGSGYAAHTAPGDDGDCTTAVTCSICQYVFKAAKAAHDLTKTEENDASCTAPGNSAYWSCEVCGLHFSDDQGKDKIQEDSWIIPASGHDFENGLWIADNENHHWKQCKNCDEEDTKNEAPHAYTDWKKTDEETHTGTCECGRTQAEPHTEQSAATCHTQAVCAVCATGYGELGAANHTLTYAANDTTDTITETCTNGCGHTAAAKLTVPADAMYNKNIPHEASAVYDEGWLGDREEPVHSDGKNTGISPVKAGDYTATLTLEEQTVTGAYTIAKAQQPDNAITMDSAVTFPNAPVITSEAVQENAQVSYKIVVGAQSSSWDVATVEEDGTIKLLRDGIFYVEAVLAETDNYQEFRIDMICTVSPGTLTVTPGEGYEGTYDGRPHTINSPVCEDAVIRYAQGKTQPDTIDSETLPRFTDVGEYTVWYQITRTGYTTVTGSLDVNITPKALTDEDFTVPTTGITYTGSQIKPAVTPREGLREGTDYTVSYGANIHNATGGSITITGTGNYQGSVEITFPIAPQTLTAPQAAAIQFTQSASGELTVTWPEAANASGYTVTLYKGASAAGTDVDTAAPSHTFQGLTEGAYRVSVTVKGEEDYASSQPSETTEPVYLRTILWKDGDGSTLLTQLLLDGVTPAYSGDTPTKQPGTDRTYVFSGSWSPVIAPVTENVTYTAQFDASFNAPEADDGSFSIDYEQETITVAQGYEVSTSPDFTGTALEDGASISDYLGKTLYIRREAQTDPEVAPSAALSIPLEARPQAPGSGSYTIDYAGETAQAEGDYEISTDGETWGKGPMAVTPGEKVYVRKASDGDKPAGETLTETLASRPATPAAPVLDSKTDTVLNVKTVSGLEYSLDGETWQESGRFTGLTEDTAYTVVTRVAATETTFASEISPALTVSTKKPAPKAPQLTIDAVTDTTVTIAPVEGAEYSKDGGVTWQDSNVFEQLTPETRYMFAIRIQETQDTVAGRAVAEYQYTAPAAPASGDGYTIDYENERASAQTGYEVSLDGETWGKGPLDIEPGKTIQVRKKAVDGKPAGMILTDTLAARPAAPTLTDITVTGESVANKGDGKITGITDKMEYRITPKDGAAGRWTDGDGDDLTDLAAGTKVEIRIKAVTGETPAFAGEILEITIQASTVQLTVTFVSAQGTAPADQKVNYGAVPTKPADLTATGYTFGGWYADSGFETEFDFDAQILADTTVYVKWTVNRYTITFQNTGDNPIDPITQDYGTPVTAPGDPIRIGYFFDGWDKPIPATMPAENLTITAQWDTVGYKIIEGAKQRVYKGNSATFVSDAPYDKFVAVLVDDVVIGSDECTVVSGSTKVILKASYIRNLTNGEHTLTVLSEDGWASTTFTVKTRIYYDSPRTGDTTNTGLWITLAAVGAAGMLAAILGKKHLKKRK